MSEDIPRDVTIQLNDASGNPIKLHVDAKDIYKNWEKETKKGKRCKTMGCGNASVVFRCTIQGTELAIKNPIVSKKCTAVSELVNEAKAGRGLDHYAVVKFYDVVMYKSKYYLVFEACGGSVDKLLKRRNDTCKKLQIEVKTPDAVTCRVFHCLIAGMDYLHRRPPSICHLNINPSNVLYSKHSSCFKIADFGVSSQRMSAALSGQTVQKNQQTVYIPAEFVHDPKHIPTSSYDIWSIAMTVAEVAQGEQPVTKAVRLENPGENIVDPSQIDWLGKRYSQLEKDGKLGEPFFGDDNNAIPEELLSVWKQMTTASEDYRIRYRQVDHAPAEDIMDDGNEVDNQLILDRERGKVLRDNGYVGPGTGLVDTAVFKRYEVMTQEWKDEVTAFIVQFGSRQQSP